MNNSSFSTRVLLLSALLLAGLALTLSAPRQAPAPAPMPAIQPPIAASSSDDPLLHVTLRTGQALVPARGSETWAEVDVWLDERARAAADQPVSVALVLDHSGSMAGNKLAEATEAAHALVNRLGERDAFALVTFSSDVAKTRLTRMDTSGRTAMHAAIDAVSAAGGTNISAGVTEAAAVLSGATGVRRLVLVTDGHPTVGLTSEHELADVVTRVHSSGVTLTALGVGSDFDGMMMQHLAERGGGMYGFLANAAVLHEVLSQELDAARTTVSREVALTLEAGAGATVTEVAGRLPLAMGAVTTLQLPALHPGEHTRVFARLRTPEGAVGARLPLTARATWRGMDEVLHLGVASLWLTTVEDDELATNSRNHEVFERGVSAFASTQLVAAAAAYERGDQSAAESLLASARSLFGMSADALAGETEVQKVRQLATQSGEALRSSARGLERKKLANFGKETSGY